MRLAVMSIRFHCYAISYFAYSVIILNFENR